MYIALSFWMSIWRLFSNGQSILPASLQGSSAVSGVNGPPVENDSIGAMDGESDFRLPKRRRTRSRRNAVEHSTFSPDALRQVPTC